MDLLETLLRIKEGVGDELFRDALAILESEQPRSAPPRHPTPPDPDGLVRKRAPSGRTKLPHNFICTKGHRHSVRNGADLLHANTDRCLLQRIVLEWLAMNEDDDAC